MGLVLIKKEKKTSRGFFKKRLQSFLKQEILEIKPPEVYLFVVKTKSNLIVSALDEVNRKVLFVETTGASILGFLDRKFRRSLDAIKILGSTIAKKLVSLRRYSVRVFFKGLRFFRFFFLKELLSNSNIKLLSFSDITCVPHNGCSLRKKRRYKKHIKPRKRV
jgi:ribosomal protein S11